MGRSFGNDADTPAQAGKTKLFFSETREAVAFRKKDWPPIHPSGRLIPWQLKTFTIVLGGGDATFINDGHTTFQAWEREIIISKSFWLSRKGEAYVWLRSFYFAEVIGKGPSWTSR